MVFHTPHTCGLFLEQELAAQQLRLGALGRSQHRTPSQSPPCGAFPENCRAEQCVVQHPGPSTRACL